MTCKKHGIWQSSEYFNELGKEDEIRYKEKLTLSHGTTITDIYGLSDNWKNDVLLLPDISWAEIYNYLINMPGAYIHESSKAYKSLDAFNSFVCNHVQDVFYHSVSKELKFCSVKTKVKVKLHDFKNAYEWVQFLVKFQDLEVWSSSNNNEFFPNSFNNNIIIMNSFDLAFSNSVVLLFITTDLSI